MPNEPISGQSPVSNPREQNRFGQPSVSRLPANLLPHPQPRRETMAAW
jgi:hypothetical protein